MEAEILIFITMFIVIFGIAYLRYSTRNKERLALIEKGADASIFFSNKKLSPSLTWKIIILNLAVLFMGIGIGVFIGSILHHNLGVEEGVAFAGTIFLMAGIGLFTGFTLTKKLARE
ncbi:hypothetical protein GWK08_01985 [Leptobacterium flavescens]|uniref:DUF6249 domain-containing protein n=1 Tax=Leptobacterium flavescens TaxID=472055 RepID=A0A6P0UIC0_9FLAO|nr:DUF6249 domain-containing protein [Leptobacterium flavescens]NER12200.1 hypothetical protein [Leptobacterium flavescens]